MEMFVRVLAGIDAVIMLSVAITALIEWRQNNGKWHSASNPPSTQRNVIVIVNGTERRAWRSTFTWFMYPPDSREVFDCIPCKPTKWREI